MIRTELIQPVHALLAGHAAGRGDEASFRDDRTSLTWAQLETRTRRLAAHLGDRVERGAVVAICMANRVEAVEAYLAVTRTSAIGHSSTPGPVIGSWPT